MAEVKLDYLVSSACEYYSGSKPKDYYKMISVSSSSVTWSYTICFESCRFAFYIVRPIQSHYYLFLDWVWPHHLFRKGLYRSDNYSYIIDCFHLALTSNLKMELALVEGKDLLTEDGRTIHIYAVIIGGLALLSSFLGDLTFSMFLPLFSWKQKN